MTDTFKVFLDGNFVGTAPSISEGVTLAHTMANRLKLIGSVSYFIIDDKNNKRSQGSLYST